MDGDETVLVVLGAGASYDCLSRHRPLGEPADYTGVLRRPPLTKDLPDVPLVNELLGQWPGATGVIEYLRSELDTQNGQPTDTLEVALQKYEDSADWIVQRGAHLLWFRFLLRDLFQSCGESVLLADGGVTNYTTLVRRLSEWGAGRDRRRAVIVSFNYDSLIDDALARDDPDYNRVNHRSDFFTLVKPHGSIAWIEEFHDFVISRGHAPTLSVEALRRRYLQLGTLRHGVRPASRDDEFLAANERRAGYIPALALPIDGKSGFVCPDGHLERLTELAPGRVTHLLTIGWRAAEPHFLRRLRSLVSDQAKGLIVTGGSPAEASGVLRRVRASTGVEPGTFRSTSRGFTALMRREVDHLSWLFG